MVILGAVLSVNKIRRYHTANQPYSLNHGLNEQSRSSMSLLLVPGFDAWDIDSVVLPDEMWMIERLRRRRLAVVIRRQKSLWWSYPEQGFSRMSVLVETILSPVPLAVNFESV